MGEIALKAVEPEDSAVSYSTVVAKRALVVGQGREGCSFVGDPDHLGRAVSSLAWSRVRTSQSGFLDSSLAQCPADFLKPDSAL